MNLEANITNSTGPPPEFYSNPYFIIVVHVVNFLLGLPINVYIMVLHLGKQRKMDLTNVFTFNQAAVEIFFMLFSPFHCMCGITINLCLFKPMGFLLGSGMTFRALFQCLVCIERYIAVVHPVIFLKFKPLQYRVVPSIMAWMLGLACGIVCMMTFPNLPYKMFVVIYLILLMVTLYNCLSVLKKLKHPGPGDRAKKREDGAKQRAFEIITINLLAFLIQTIPLTITFGFQGNLPLVNFRTATTISLGLNLLMGWVQAVFMLYRAGNLPFRGCT